MALCSAGKNLALRMQCIIFRGAVSSGADGSGPIGGLIDSAGMLYGTAPKGGAPDAAALVVARCIRMIQNLGLWITTGAI